MIAGLRSLLLGIGLLAALASFYAISQHRIAAAEQRATVADSVNRNLSAQLAAAQVSEHIVTQYVDRVQVIHDQGATITKDIPAYVTPKADTACAIPVGFVRVHNAAAEGNLPERAGNFDAQASGLALSAVAGAVVDNYTTCHAMAEQLSALQRWVRVHTSASP